MYFIIFETQLVATVWKSHRKFYTRDVVSTTGKASSFVLAVRHVIDGDQTALKAKDIHYSALDDDHCLLLLYYL